MAAVCDICGKKPSFGMSVSHSHRRTKRRWNPNIQRVRALVNGAPKRLHVCTSCIRAGKVTKPFAAPRPRPPAERRASAGDRLRVGVRAVRSAQRCCHPRRQVAAPQRPLRRVRGHHPDPVRGRSPAGPRPFGSASTSPAPMTTTSS
jgi:large subunit ribosomal protein L28